MQLGDAEAIGALHHHDRGLGHVDADLDHRGRHQHLDLPPPELRHRLLPGRRCHLPVQQPDLQPGQLVRLQPLVLLGGRAGLDPEGVADQRADDEGPVARCHLLADPVPGDVLVGRQRQPLRGHLRPAGRQLVEHREVEVTENDHGGGAGNGCGRHHQEVGIALVAFGAQRGPLLDAEPVLLVDDHHAERLERDLLGQQGVRPHHDGDIPGRQVRQHLRPGLALDPARQQLHADVERTEHLAYGHGVLLGQHLGRHHERPLVPALHRTEQRGQRHHGLSRADVALEEPVHGERTGQVGHDHCQRTPLGRRQLVGQCTQELRHEGAADTTGDLAGGHIVAQGPGVVLEGPPAEHQGQLQAEQLVEGQPSPGRPDHVDRRGLVDGLHGRRAVPQAERGEPFPGQRVEERTGPLERLLHERPDLPAGEPRLGRGRVDRQDPQGAALAAHDVVVHPRHDVDHRVDHLARAPVVPHLPPEDGLGPLPQLLGPPGLVEEGDFHRPRLVAHDDGDGGLAVAVVPAATAASHPHHLGQHGRRRPDVESRHAGLGRAIDVAVLARERHQ